MTTQRRRRWFRFGLRTIFALVGIVLLGVPISFIVAYGLSGTLGGLVIIGGLALLQWPIYLLFRRILRKPDRDFELRPADRPTH